jgi:hypothetical protein
MEFENGLSLLVAFTMLAAALVTPGTILADNDQPDGSVETARNQRGCRRRAYRQSNGRTDRSSNGCTDEISTEVPTTSPTEVPTETAVNSVTAAPTDEVAATPTIAPTESVVSAQSLSLISPIDNAILYVKKPTFQWNAEDATKYQYYVYRITIGGVTKIYDRTVNSSICSSGICSSTPSTALVYGNYEWKIRSYKDGEWSDFSDFAYFTVATNVPSPKSPITTIYDNEPTFSWTEIIGATEYQIAVYSSSNKRVLNLVTDDFTCTDSVCRVAATDSLSNGVYKWRVRAYYKDEWRGYSDYKKFTIAGDFSTAFNGSATGWSKVVGANWTYYAKKYYYTYGIAKMMTSAKYKYTYEDFDYEVYMKREGGLVSGSYPPATSACAWPIAQIRKTCGTAATSWIYQHG